MDKATRVGIDLAKMVFHVAAVDDGGTVLERKRLRRAGLQSYLSRLPTGCVIAMEACGGAHHWGRLAIRHGHRVLMMSPQFVVPYAKGLEGPLADLSRRVHMGVYRMTQSAQSVTNAGRSIHDL